MNNGIVINYPCFRHYFRFFAFNLKDGDECLSPAEVAELLAVCPEDGVHVSGAAGVGAAVGVEDFGLCVETNSKGWITRRGFMAHWA